MHQDLHSKRSIESGSKFLSSQTRNCKEQNTQTRNKETFRKWTKTDHAHSRPNIIYGLDCEMRHRCPNYVFIIFV